MQNSYRPDIDGLRAISVLLVLLFHADLFAIKAGFIGVDIFFVISGYLITTGIKNDLEKGNFSFIEFYKRRLWRLQPAYIALLLVSTLITTLIYLPNNYLDFTNSAEWATQFQANRYFSELKTGYFADDTSVMPLLHTWSLSIEWQWYLLLPFLMFAFYRVLKIKKWTDWIFPLTFIMVIVAFNLLGDRSRPHYYYSFAARIFEMLIGSCLAVVEIKSINRISSRVKAFIGVVCLGIISYAAFNKNVIDFYPNWWALAVCVSGALIIYIGGGEKGNFISELLSIKPLVFIGTISYSLYLWHWPVFAFMRYLAVDEVLIVKLICLLFSFFLAIYSTKLIERPLRKLHTLSFMKTILLLLVFPNFIAITFNYYSIKNDGFPERFSSKLTEVGSTLKEWEPKEKLRDSCYNTPENINKSLTQCVSGAIDSKRTAFLFGDSYANHSMWMMDVLAKDADVKLVSLATKSCLTLPNIYMRRNGKDETDALFYHECRENTEKYYHTIKNNHFDYVIFGQNWSSYVNSEEITNKIGEERSVSLNRKRIEEALDKAILFVIKVGSRPIIISEPYSFQSDNQNRANDAGCYNNQGIKNENYQGECDINLKNETLGDGEIWLRDLFVKLKKKYPQLIIIDQKKLQCDNDTCRVEIGGIPIYRDTSGHITDYAAHQFGKKYLNLFGNPFKD